MSKTSKYTGRILARIVIEATTPIAIGSGETNILTDAPILTDVNRLPFIPGTTLAGIFRHTLTGDEAKSIFGYQGKTINEGMGSKVIFTDAKILGKDGIPVDGLYRVDFSDEFYKHFNVLPVRQHVRINKKGVSEQGGKFDSEIVYKGARFCFEVELVTDKKKEDKEIAKKELRDILDRLATVSFRIGSGSRNGLGAIKVQEYHIDVLDLFDQNDLKRYLEKTSCLSDTTFWINTERVTLEKNCSTGWRNYRLELIPDDFFLFGAGYGNNDDDITAVTESYVTWTNGRPEFKENCILIPATSIKGTLAHRVAFHYNKNNNLFVGNENAKAGTENPAVNSLFGNDNPKNLSRGKVIFSDIIEAPNNGVKKKLLNHVAIDRFTGGAIDGALFSEEVIYGDGQQYTLEISVEEDALNDSKIENALEDALKDICIGMLPLGGGVNRGNGCFNGIIYKNNEEL